MRLLSVFLVACALHASPWSKLYKISVAVVAAASVADAATSMGKGELNPALRSPDQRFGARGIEIKSGIVAGTLLTGWLATRKHSRAPAVVANFATAAVYGATALHNTKVK